jgi:hypothetical protein
MWRLGVPRTAFTEVTKGERRKLNRNLRRLQTSGSNRLFHFPTLIPIFQL